MLARRTGGPKSILPLDHLGDVLNAEVESMQVALFEAARSRRDAATLRHPKSKQEFIDFIAGDGGFVYAGWCGDPAVEAEIKEATKATIRCLPDPEFCQGESATTCIWTGRPAVHEALWARAY